MKQLNAHQLLLDNNIRAQVHVYWDSDLNPGCKFEPNDRVRVRYSPTIKKFKSSAMKARMGQRSRVIAATTVNGEAFTNLNRRNGPIRKTTRYYVAFKDGYVSGIDSCCLAKA